MKRNTLRLCAAGLAPRRVFDAARRTPAGRVAGFTLAEVLVCVVLISIGFVALVAAFGHDTRSAQAGEDVTLATFLADEIHDRVLQMTFSSVLDLDGTTNDPAILSTGSTEDLATWSQKITVTPVAVGNLNQVVARTGATAARLTVEVRAHGKPVTTQTYYLLDRSGVPFTDVGG